MDFKKMNLLKQITVLFFSVVTLSKVQPSGNTDGISFEAKNKLKTNKVTA